MIKNDYRMNLLKNLTHKNKYFDISIDFSLTEFSHDII